MVEVEEGGPLFVDLDGTLHYDSYDEVASVVAVLLLDGVDMVAADVFHWHNSHDRHYSWKPDDVNQRLPDDHRDYRHLHEKGVVLSPVAVDDEVAAAVVDLSAVDNNCVVPHMAAAVVADDNSYAWAFCVILHNHCCRAHNHWVAVVLVLPLHHLPHIHHIASYS